MSIAPYGTNALAALRTGDTFTSIKSDLATVQAQLTSGKTADTVAGLGTNAATALRLNARLSTLSDYASNVSDAQLRTKLMINGATQIAKLASALPTSVGSANTTTAIGQSSAAVSAQDGLQQTIDILNTEVGGRYLFAGRAADAEPVASYDLIMNGDDAHAGLKTLIAQRKAADLGSNGVGRLGLTSAGTDVSLSEPAGAIPFGLKITDADATGAGITAARNAGPPVSADISVGAQPAVGDTVTVTLSLPDDTTATITLVAAGTPSTTTDGATAFAIGDTAAATAANLTAALRSAVLTLGSTTLASASAMKAGTDFFAGTAATPTMRVDGPPYDTATALVGGTGANTVTWYKGDTSGSARLTAPVRIGDNQTVGIGAEADEPAFQATLASYAVMAAETFSGTDTTSAGRLAALATRVSALLLPTDGSQAAGDIVTDLAAADGKLAAAKTQLAATKAQVKDTLGGIENADPNEAAMKLMETQTRLQASYQTTAAVQKLSLVNYL